MARYENFVPQSSGVVDGVSYVLVAQDGSELHFKGYLDYEGDLVATRIPTGGHGRGAVDKQPGHPKCSRACAKNSTELLVVTVYKNKSVNLSIARLKEANLPPDMSPNWACVPQALWYTTYNGSNCRNGCEGNRCEGVSLTDPLFVNSS